VKGVDVKHFNSARSIIGISGLIVCALISNLKLLSENAHTNLDVIGKDGITLLQQRFEPVKRQLPRSGMVRYIPDSQSPDNQYFFLTQYILAPIIVTQSLGPQMAVYVDPLPRADSDPSDASFTVNKYADGTRILDFHNGIKLARTAEVGSQ
jgi:hypothetical protein